MIEISSRPSNDSIFLSLLNIYSIKLWIKEFLDKKIVKIIFI
jgi:hypothetical protein